MAGSAHSQRRSRSPSARNQATPRAGSSWNAVWLSGKTTAEQAEGAIAARGGQLRREEQLDQRQQFRPQAQQPAHVVAGGEKEPDGQEQAPGPHGAHGLAGQRMAAIAALRELRWRACCAGVAVHAREGDEQDVEEQLLVAEALLPSR